MTSAPAPGPPDGPEITFLTNIPNHHNAYLYRELRGLGPDVQAIFKGLPASEGRPWDLRPQPPDRVAANLWQERQVFRRPRPGTEQALILCGSWATPRDALRRLVATASHLRGSKVLAWGEPMSDRRGARNLARQLYYSSSGLDAVLAIGSHAVDSYRQATRGRLPIHVFPYTTSSGLAVAPRRRSQPLVGFAGRLISLKGADVAIRALGAIPAPDRPGLDVVGSGPLAPSLEALARSLGVDATFHGEVGPDRLMEIRSHWWACLVPSLGVDGWGLVVPEALNSAVPVVASGFVGSAHDLVRDGVNGAIVQRSSATDPETWATTISTVLAQDPEALATQARTVGRAFSPTHGAAWLRDLLRGDLTVERSFITDGWTRLESAR